MNLIKIAIANIKSKPLNAVLSLLLLGFGVGLISLLLLMQVQLSKQFHKNIDKIDLVLGAKGSPMQLILSSVYQVDAPTGNIALTEARVMMKNLFVEQAIPLAYGDSYKDYRIVGTTEDYPKLFEAELVEGRLFEKTFEVCLGSKVATESGLKIGDQFFSAHGLDGEGEAHEDHPFTVVGIFGDSQTVVDKVIVTSVKTMWDVHAGHNHDHPGHDHDEHDDHNHDDHADHDHDDHDDHSNHDHGEEQESQEQEREVSAEALQTGKYLMYPENDDKEITAALLIKNSRNIFNMIGNLVRTTDMQAVMPSVEVNRLENNFGMGMKTLYYLGSLVAFLSFLSVFISLYNSLKERKYELALIRTMGGSRRHLFLLIILEGFILSAIGFMIGIALSRTGLLIVSNRLEENFQYSIGELGMLSMEWILLVATLLIGVLASFLPALSAMRMDISKTLQDA